MLSRVSALFTTHSSPLSIRSRRSKSRRQTVGGEMLETRELLAAAGLGANLYTQNFDTLVSSGSAAVTGGEFPAGALNGWFFSESGSNANTTYTAGTGSGNTGDTYSFGTDTDRAFGGVQSGSLVPTIGVQFQNANASAITELAVSYVGEMWRLGSNNVDRLDFQYSLNATSLTTGTWIDVNSLDFSSPDTTGTAGARNGNAAGFRTNLSASITGLNIAPASIFWIRWTDFNGTSTDSGLAVDDFSITATAGSDTTPPTVSTLSPLDNATAVVPSSNLVVTFSEPVQKGTAGDVQILRVSDNEAVYSVPVTDASISVSGAVVTINPPANLAGSTDYYVNIAAGAFRDLATVPNDFAGITGTNAWNFTTAAVDSTPPTLTSITDSVTGGPSFTNQPITFTVTFSEDIIDSGDGAVTAADFNNAGTSTVTFGAITETSPGVFTVVVTPTTAGTVQLRIPTTAQIADLGGNIVDVTTALLDDTTVTINASTTLGAGDIAVIGYNTNGTPSDSFTILVLTDLLPGTTFFVNDNEIAADGNASFADLVEGEASFTVKTGQTITAGTVISLPWGAAAVSTTTYDWSSTSGFGLGNNNEEIYIYTAPLISSTTPTAFIYGVDIGTSTTARPAGLVAGVSFISPTSTASRYKTTGATYTGSKSNLLAAIGNTAANWEALAPGATTDWTFSVGSDTTPPTLASMDDNDNDDTVASGDSLTYTVTFSEDIDSATVTAADFDNDGTAGITIGTVTETSAGVFSVQVATTSAGTLRLRIPAGSVIKDVAGNDLVVPVSDDTVVTVTAGDVTAPTVTSITDNTVDGVIGVGATVIYTVTFSEDIDQATVSSADFDNAGNSSVTFGTITETSAGVFTVPVTATNAGTVQLRIPTNAAISDVAGNALVVNPAILDAETITVDGTAPTLTSINDNVGGGPAFLNQPITFTVTFNEDIDASTVAAGDFNNAGTASISVGTITETSPGVFAVVVMPTTTGTLQFRIPTGSEISDLGGNNMAVPQTDDTIVTAINSSLVTGDIAFVGYNGDGNDDFAFVALASIPGGERIVFTDNEWSGTAFNTGEGEIVWTAPSGGVAAGTVVHINNAAVVATLSATVGTVSGLLAIGASDEAIFAITGSQSGPTAFLSVITNDAGTGLTSLANTGLVMGVNSVDFTAVDIDADVMAYIGARSTRGTYAAYRRLINDPANWITQDASGDQHSDGIAPDVPFSNTGFALATQSSILLINEVVFNPLAATDTGEEYLELRGTPNTIVPEDAFLVLLEGDSESGAGQVDHIFDIRGMAFGSNGFLVLRQFGSTYTNDAASNVFTATSSGWGASWSSRATDLENESVSVLLVQTSVNPIADNDVDTDNNGTLDGAGALWTIRDGIGNIDGGATDTGYGILNTSGNGNGLVPSGSSLINLNGYHPDYMARNGSSTGHSLLTTTSSDWVVGELAGAMPNATLATGGFTRPAAYEGAALNHIGAANSFSGGNQAPTDIALSATTLVENAGANAMIGTFSGVDPNSGDTLSFSLPAGVTSNDLFNVSGTSLRANASFDFEAGSSYTITARVTDAGGLTFNRQFTITITDVNEATFTRNIFYNTNAAAEQNILSNGTGQRSMIRNVQVVFNGNVAVSTGAVSNASFVLIRLGSNQNIGLTVVSRVFAGGFTTVVLGFTSGTHSVSGSLNDGNYRLVIDYSVLGIDGNGDGQLGGLGTTNFHRFFGDSDGDRDVDSRDTANYRAGLRGNASWLSLFDFDNDGSLLSGGFQDQQDKDAFFSNFGGGISPL
jgi:hypothetical protein